MNAFMTHPSVRIKGTENNYEPVQCVSPNCPNRNPHMHCPFCVTTESYHDPVILKAHYRVKHVDKGIDFAGLKILRCCDHCDIVGTIKGSKEFKGAHWHCYRCRNGFNRRDEAIKHYRTHFRNPQTTFQIQIAQEVYKDNFESANAASTITHIAQDESQEAYTTVQSDGNQVNGKEGEIQVSVAANETVGAEGQTIMIIQADEHLDASQVQNALSNANIQEVANIEYTSSGDAEKEKWEEKVSELQQQLNKADVEHRERESKLRAEISVLKSKLQSQASEIASLQKREQELLSQLSVPLDNHIHELLGQLKSEHEDLLHHQLAQVRRAYIQQYCQETISITTERSSESALSGNIVFVQSPGGSNIRLMEEGSTGELTEGTVGASRIVIMKSEEAHTSENESGREVVDNGTSEIVVDTDDQVKMNSSPQSAVLSSTENETVVEVTVSGVTRNIDIEAEGSEQNEENSEGSSPRAKRRKKSH